MGKYTYIALKTLQEKTQAPVVPVVGDCERSELSERSLGPKPDFEGKGVMWEDWQKMAKAITRWNEQISRRNKKKENPI